VEVDDIIKQEMVIDDYDEKEEKIIEKGEAGMVLD